MGYEVKAITKTIKATSRASVKVGDSYYTVEYSEERALPEIEELNATDISGKIHVEILNDFDIEKEKKFLWEDVNAECDNQIADILKTFKK